VWVAFLGLNIFGTGLVMLMKFLPPLAPALTPPEVGAYFRDNQNPILAGAICLQFGAICFVYFNMAVTQLIGKMEAPSRFWTHNFICGSILGYIGVFFAYSLWSAAAFRPERADEIIQLVNDITVLIFVALVSPALMMFGALGFAIFGDRSPVKFYPRWVGYLSIWAAIGTMPSAFVGFFTKGPFAWNGIVGFWIPLVVFTAWIFVVMWYTGKAFLRLQREEAA
jgi:hypothetical protein